MKVHRFLLGVVTGLAITVCGWEYMNIVGYDKIPYGIGYLVGATATISMYVVGGILKSPSDEAYLERVYKREM